MSYIQLKDKTLEYDIIRKSNKRVYLRVKDGKLVITAPTFMSIKSIEEFILEHEDWINKQLNTVNRKVFIVEDNKRVKIISNYYTIHYCDKCDISEETIYLDSTRAYSDFLAILEYKLTQYALPRLHFYFEAMGLDNTHFPTINFKNLKSQHGHYNRVKHEITLSISLALLDEELIDYVIVHELAHIKYFNHQDEFYDFISSVLPNYKTLIKRLKKEGENV